MHYINVTGRLVSENDPTAKLTSLLQALYHLIDRLLAPRPNYCRVYAAYGLEKSLVILLRMAVPDTQSLSRNQIMINCVTTKLECKGIIRDLCEEVHCPWPSGE